MWILKFTPIARTGLGYWQVDERPRFLVRLGNQWPHHPERRYIEEVTINSEEAKVFATEEEALETLSKAGHPAGWETVPV